MEVARQLRLSGIAVTSAHDLDRLGASDRFHLETALEMGAVLCTHDQDFLRLAALGEEHAGIAFLPQHQAQVGTWVRALRALHGARSPEDAHGQVFFL